MSEQERLLGALCPTGLRALAEWHVRQAELCRDRAARLDAQAEGRRAAEARVAEAFASPIIVARFIGAGMHLDEACQAAAQASGLPVETLRRHWQRHLRDTAQQARAERDRLIFHLAQLSLSNREIAQRTGLHEVSVSRILSRLLGRSA